MHEAQVRNFIAVPIFLHLTSAGASPAMTAQSKYSATQERSRASLVLFVFPYFETRNNGMSLPWVYLVYYGGCVQHASNRKHTDRHRPTHTDDNWLNPKGIFFDCVQQVHILHTHFSSLSYCWKFLLFCLTITTRYSQFSLIRATTDSIWIIRSVRNPIHAQLFWDLSLTLNLWGIRNRWTETLLMSEKFKWSICLWRKFIKRRTQYMLQDHITKTTDHRL